MATLFDKIDPVKYAEVAIEKTAKSSGLNSLLALNVLIDVPILLAIVYMKSLVVSILGLIIILLLCLAAIKGFFTLVEIDPQLVRSEDSQKQMKRLAIIEAALGDNKTTIEEITKKNPDLLEVIEDPDTKRLEEGV